MAEASIIESIKAKIYRLISENEGLRKECGDLVLMEGKLKSENRELVEKVAMLEKRIKLLELKDGMTGARDDVKLAKARINNLMREIDKCIALMNR